MAEKKYEIVSDMPETLQEKYRAEIAPISDENAAYFDKLIADGKDVNSEEALAKAKATDEALEAIFSRYMSGAEG